MDVYIVQRDNIDGLYAFENEDQRDRYAALFPGAEVGTVTVLDGEAAERLIATERGKEEEAPTLYELHAALGRMIAQGEGERRVLVSEGGDRPQLWAVLEMVAEDDDARPGMLAVADVDIEGEAPTLDARWRRYVQHSDDSGTWCRWSYVAAPRDATDDARCPTGCRASGVEDGPA